jgi:hypothetical protein
VAQQLADATLQAETIQIKEVPAIVLDGELFAGERSVERAAEQMAAGGAPGAAAGAQAR